MCLKEADKRDPMRTDIETLYVQYQRELAKQLEEQQAGEETIVFMLDTMIDYFSHDNPNFNEKIFRSQITSP